MKKGLQTLLACFLFLLISASASYAQGIVTGKVIDAVTKEGLPGASVAIEGTTNGTTTNVDGEFSLSSSSSSVKLIINYIGYKRKEVTVSTKGGKDLGSISLESISTSMSEIIVIANSTAIDRKTPVAVSTITTQQIEEKLGNQEFPELLKSTPGVYATKQGGGFGDSRINMRGFSSQNVAVVVNGVPVNDMENGVVYWSNWAGLSDVTRSQQTQRGLGATKVAVPSIGGTINIQTKTTDYIKGGSVFSGIGNDGYKKTSMSYSTGLTDDKWSVSLSAAKTSGQMWAQGTQFVGYNYFFNVSKVLSAKHTISLTGFGAPQRHGQRQNRQTISFYKDAPDGLKTNNDFGYKNGQVINVEDNFYHKPQFSLNHFWTIDETSSLSTAVYYSFGTGGGGGYSGLNFDNYRVSNKYSPYDLDAIVDLNQTTPDGRAQGYLRASRNDHQWYGLLSTYNKKLTDKIDLLAGLDVRDYTGRHFTEVTDVLGADYVYDNSDVNNRNRRANVGDKISYFNDGKTRWLGGFLQGEYSNDKLSGFVSLSLSNSAYQRIDYFLYTPDKQKTDWINFLGYMAKGGANYNLDEHNNIFVNAGYFEKAPYNTYVFLNNTNTINPVAKNEDVTSFELGYGYRGGAFTANLNAYATKWNNRSLRPITSRDQNGVTQYANINGVNEDHKGVELEMFYKPSRQFNIKGMLSVGNWKYTNNVSDVTVFDEQNNPLYTLPTIYLDGVKVGDAAQTTAALGANYTFLKQLKVGVDYNFFGKNFANFLPDSRAGEANNGKPVYQIPDYSTVDANIKFSFKIGNFDADVYGNVNNIFNTTYISDAYDGVLPTIEVPNPTNPVNVFYGYGTTWTTGLKVKF